MAANEVREELARVAAEMDAVATRNEARAKQLLTEAETIKVAADDMLKQAAALAAAAGALRGVQQNGGEAVQETNGHGPLEPYRVTIERVGRKGRVTLDMAARAASELQSFTVAQFAEELGLKPVQVPLFITELERLEAITHEGRVYRTLRE